MAGLPRSLSESLVTLLCTNEEQGKIAAGLIDTDYLDPPYDDIAVRAVDYRRRFKQAPGLAHLDDLFDDILSDPKHKQNRLYQNILEGIIAQSDKLNAEYVMSRVNEYMDSQRLKAAVIEAGQKYTQGGSDAITDVRNILYKALKFKPTPMDAGTFLSDRKRVISILSNPVQALCGLGIPELDKRQLGPTPGEMLVFMGKKGSGKSAFCVHTGVMSLMQGLKVVHISLEMGDERVMPRYMSALFAVAKRPDEFTVTSFSGKDKNKPEFVTEQRKPKLWFSDPAIIKRLSKRMDQWGEQFGNLVVKPFPSGQLTVPQLEAYLDGLETSHGFIPHVLIIDYPDLMHLDERQEHRIAIGRVYVQLRGLFQERHVAGICPAQSNREGESAKLITAKLIGEDYSKAQTADIVLTYTQSSQERQQGLARLYVDKARNEQDDFTILIAQSYTTGQFVLESRYMPTPNYYWGEIERLSAKDENSE